MDLIQTGYFPPGEEVAPGNGGSAPCQQARRDNTRWSSPLNQDHSPIAIPVRVVAGGGGVGIAGKH